MASFIVLFVLLVGTAASASDNRLDLGRREYEMAQAQSRLPKYGDCWKRAVGELEEGCKQLDDEEQGYLALKFANCFLAKSGQLTYPCDRSEKLNDCLEGVSNNAFTAYSNFYTHTQNMCFFLQSQIWHEETESTIDRLHQTSSRVSAAIDEAAKVQEVVVERQKASLEYQRQLAANGSMLSQALDASKANIRTMLSEFKSSTDEQKTLIFDIFDRVTKLQNLVVGEISWLYTVVFYVVFLLLVYLGTATRDEIHQFLPWLAD